MKILFLPYNMASMQAIMCNALNKIEGVESRCLTIQENHYTSGNQHVIYLPRYSFQKSAPASSIVRFLKYRREVRKLIRWADVLHYVWGPVFHNGADLQLAMKLRKPIFIEWVGSDIRDPGALSEINPYYREVFNQGYEYNDLESSDYKHTVQNLFSRVGAIPILMPEMTLFLDKRLFPQYSTVLHRLNVEDYEPAFPSLTNDRPLIVHSPSVKVGKGTNIIVPIIEELKLTYNFDFKLVHGVSRKEALNIMRSADISIDQIIVGGYGMASCEAMALGKPVVNFILPEIFLAGLPPDCPIVNASPDTLKRELIRLIESPSLRHELGRRSRRFVEEHNDADKIALQLIKVYRHAL